MLSTDVAKFRNFIPCLVLIACLSEMPYFKLKGLYREVEEKKQRKKSKAAEE
jgi:hypothetical protein